MHVKELWRYPVKSLRGERIEEAFITADGIPGDRRIVVVSQARTRAITARSKYKLLGLQGHIEPDGDVTINAHRWDSAEAQRLVEEAVGEAATLMNVDTPRRFDILPLLVATDSAIAQLGFDHRRFRPNILIGGVDGLAERSWPGRQLRIGELVIHAAQLRDRCVMTTYDPDSLDQDTSVLRRIVNEYDGKLALDCSVVTPGRVRVGDPVEVLESFA